MIGGGTTPRREEPASLEHVIARLLTVGTYVSIGLMAVGLVLMLAAGLGPSGGPRFDPATVVSDILAVRPAGFLWLGLVVVVATPAARVAASLVGYSRRGEPRMAIVSALILLVIVLSVALAVGLEG